jgi:two-component system chemotaxis sensor kinase CheA
MEDFKNKYIEEANEIIAGLEEAILKLEENSGNSEVVEEVFRSMHTLKGGAAMFGFDKIRDATHELENAYDQIRSGNNTVSKALLDITLEGIDYFKNLLEENTSGLDEKYHEQLIDRITKIVEGQAEAAQASPQAGKQETKQAEAPENKEKKEEKPKAQEQEASEQQERPAKEQKEEQAEEPAAQQEEAQKEEAEEKQTEEAQPDQQPVEDSQEAPAGQTYYIYFSPHKDILKNGTNPLLLLEELSELGQAEVFPITSSIPEIDSLQPDELYISWNILLATEAPKDDEIADVFMFVEDDSTLIVNKLSDGNLLAEEAIAKNLRGVLSSDPQVSFDQIQNLVSGSQESPKKEGKETHEQAEKQEEPPQQEETPKASQQKEVYFEDEAGSGEEHVSQEEQTASVQPENTVDKTEENSQASDKKDNQEQEAETGNEEEHKQERKQPASSSTSQNKQHPEKASQPTNGGKKKNAISSIRISAEKVDELMNLVSELVTTQARLNLYAEKQDNTELEEINENIHKLTSQLRDNAFDLSLIPLQSIITRFQRLVRDLSSSLGKEVNFVTEGTDTELDKSIIENLVDPILHILRNSIDHGIEDAQARKKAGKPEKGTIKLRAYHSGASVHIQINDDGKGLDIDAIRKKGIEKGLISPNAQLTRKQIFDLIFMPGFSTNQSVTDVSGRGVGMDVVKDKISAIRGEVDLDSELNKGTTITIKLPLTLSIIDGLLVDISDTKYVVPLNVVDKIYAIKHKDLNESFYNLVVLNEKQIPYYYLRKEFNINEEAPEDEQVIVVSYEDKQIGIVVDKVIGEYQAVLKPLGKHYRKIQMISGATILGDGSVALVMDTNKIIGNFSAQNQDQQIYAN